MNIDKTRAELEKHRGNLPMLAAISGVPVETLYKIQATRLMPDGRREYLRSDIKASTAELILAGSKRMPDINKLKLKRGAK